MLSLLYTQGPVLGGVITRKSDAEGNTNYCGMLIKVLHGQWLSLHFSSRSALIKATISSSLVKMKSLAAAEVPRQVINKI